MLEFVPTADGLRLAVHRIGDRGGIPVVLSHGTFSNRRSCMGLAAFLAKQGYECWVSEWRGHGASSCPDRPHSFDDVAMLDVPAIVGAVTSLSGREDIFWVGHSGGGLILLMWMARFPHLAARHIKGMVMLASQATGAAASRRRRAVILAIDCLLRWRKTAPGHWLGIGPEAESALLMRQWCRWNLMRSFCGLDGFNYETGVSGLNLPVLALAGAGDHFIAPASDCEALASRCGTDVEFYICGKRQGFREDYTHNRLIASRNAGIEVWPLISNWLGRASGRHDAATPLERSFPAF
jgi:predicted alpha/beta hydrolase